MGARRRRPWPAPGTWSARWLWINLAVVVVLAVIRGFGDRGAFRSYQYDLANFALLAREYAEAGFVMGIKNDWLNGLGGFTYHWNPLLQVEMVAGMVGRPFYDFGISVALLLIAMFGTTYALARSLGLPRSLALQAAWLAFMFTPYRWVTLLATEPPYVMTTVLASAVVICLARAGWLNRAGQSPRAQAAWLVGATAVFAWIVIARPFAFVFVLPSLVAQVLAVAWWWRSRRQGSTGALLGRSARWVVVGCATVTVLALAYAAAFVPLAAFSGASLGRLAHDPNGFAATFAGVLANLDLPAVDASSLPAALGSTRRVLALGLIQLAPALLMIGGVAGCVVWLRVGRRRPGAQRAYAVMTLITIAFIAAFAIASEFVNTQLLIRYALLSTLPQLAIMATGLLLLVRPGLRRLRRGRDTRTRRLSGSGLRVGALVANAVVAALLLSLFYLRTESIVPGFPNTLAAGPTIDALAEAAAWPQGTTFRGRVIAVRHAGEPRALTAAELSPSWVNTEGLSWELLALKEREVPTLAPYGQLISPGLLRVSQDLFGIPGDALGRNGIVTRRLDAPMARLFGVRFAIADDVLQAPGVRPVAEVAGSPALHVYEVPDPNVSGFAPTNVITAADWPGTKAALQAGDFEPTRDVVVDVDAASDLVDLVPAASSRIMLTGQDITVTATSPGRSMLVLPFEYSACLRGVPQDQGDGFVRLQPVDGILIGLVFDRQTRVRISAVNPPWRTATCRIEDRSWWRSLFGPVLLPAGSSGP